MRADKTVVIWGQNREGLLRYSHKAKIQALAYNPVLNSLASITESDFGLWSQDQSNVVKHDLPSKGLCADWSPDGQLLAIGLYNGKVILRDKNGGKLTEVSKCSSPIWTLAFNPQKFESAENQLVIGAWNGKITTYTIV